MLNDLDIVIYTREITFCTYKEGVILALTGFAYVTSLLSYIKINILILQYRGIGITLHHSPVELSK